MDVDARPSFCINLISEILLSSSGITVQGVLVTEGCFTLSRGRPRPTPYPRRSDPSCQRSPTCRFQIKFRDLRPRPVPTKGSGRTTAGFQPHVPVAGHTTCLLYTRTRHDGVPLRLNFFCPSRCSGRRPVLEVVIS